MNKQEIITILSELHKITKLRVSLHGTDFTEIAAYPEESLPFCKRVNEDEGEHSLCVECDRAACTAALERRGTYSYKCRYGLTEAVSPLYNFGTLTGFLMMGQIAKSEGDVLAAKKVALAFLESREADRLCSEIPIVSLDMVNSYVKIMTVCAQYLTLSNAMPAAKPSTAELAKKYIKDNISKKFNISDICEELCCSKSTLLTAFKKRYGTTVNSYINDVRLELATVLLLEGVRSISQIAQETGFSDQSYFSKVFSAKYGMPPSEYRASLSEEHK